MSGSLKHIYEVCPETDAVAAQHPVLGRVLVLALTNNKAAVAYNSNGEMKTTTVDASAFIPTYTHSPR